MKNLLANRWGFNPNEFMADVPFFFLSEYYGRCTLRQESFYYHIKRQKNPKGRLVGFFVPLYVTQGFPLWQIYFLSFYGVTQKFHNIKQIA